MQWSSRGVWSDRPSRNVACQHRHTPSQPLLRAQMNAHESTTRIDVATLHPHTSLTASCNRACARRERGATQSGSSMAAAIHGGRECTSTLTSVEYASSPEKNGKTNDIKNRKFRKSDNRCGVQHCASCATHSRSKRPCKGSRATSKRCHMAINGAMGGDSTLGAARMVALNTTRHASLRRRRPACAMEPVGGGGGVRRTKQNVPNQPSLM